jgi:hypothetical protein
VKVWLDGAWLAQHLAALDVFTLGAAQQDADVVACLTLVKQFWNTTPVQMVLRQQYRRFRFLRRL